MGSNKPKKFKSEVLQKASELVKDMEDQRSYQLTGEDVPELFRGEILTGKTWKQIFKL